MISTGASRSAKVYRRYQGGDAFGIDGIAGPVDGDFDALPGIAHIGRAREGASRRRHALRLQLGFGFGTDLGEGRADDIEIIIWRALDLGTDRIILQIRRQQSDGA